jgi:hypothetical protein
VLAFSRLRVAASDATSNSPSTERALDLFAGVRLSNKNQNLAANEQGEVGWLIENCSVCAVPYYSVFFFSFYTRLFRQKPRHHLQLFHSE